MCPLPSAIGIETCTLFHLKRVTVVICTMARPVCVIVMLGALFQPPVLYSTKSRSPLTVSSCSLRGLVLVDQ